MRGIHVTDITPVEAGSGDAVHFEHDGKHYVYESWSTDNASGSDLYCDNRPASVPDGIDEDEFHEYMDEVVLPAWWDTWREIVAPAKQRAVEKVVTMLAVAQIDHEDGE